VVDHDLSTQLVFCAYPWGYACLFSSVVVKDLRLKDKNKDKDLMSKDEDKDEDLRLEDKDKDLGRH